MDNSYRRARKPPAPQQSSSDLYSTVVIHDQRNAEQSGGGPSSADIYATMVRKDDDETDDDLLPPLLKRLPKDFGLDPTLNSEADNDRYGGDSSVSGTMIVKNSTSSKAPQYWDRTGKGSYGNAASYRRRFAEEDDEGAGDFSTFVVRRGEENDEEEDEEEMGSGTVVRRTARTARNSGGGGGTMSRAVASMQAVGEIGGKQRKGGAGGMVEDGGSGDGWLRGHGSGKVSTSSIPDSVTKEDPSTKYDLLHELGKLFFKVLAFSIFYTFKWIFAFSGFIGSWSSLL